MCVHYYNILFQLVSLTLSLLYITINECVDILSQLIQAYPTHKKFSHMIILTNTNPEIDFFENIRHLQLHRRTKALRMLSIVCAKGDLSQYSMMSFLLPLASHVVFCVPGEREHNLLLEAVNVIGGVASQFNYYHLLRHYLRQLPRQQTHTRI